MCCLVYVCACGVCVWVRHISLFVVVGVLLLCLTIRFFSLPRYTGELRKAAITAFMWRRARSLIFYLDSEQQVDQLAQRGPLLVVLVPVPPSQQDRERVERFNRAPPRRKARQSCFSLIPPQPERDYLDGQLRNMMTQLHGLLSFAYVEGEVAEGLIDRFDVYYEHHRPEMAVVMVFAEDAPHRAHVVLEGHYSAASLVKSMAYPLLGWVEPDSYQWLAGRLIGERAGDRGKPMVWVYLDVADTEGTVLVTNAVKAVAAEHWWDLTFVRIDGNLFADHGAQYGMRTTPYVVLLDVNKMAQFRFKPQPATTDITVDTLSSWIGDFLDGRLRKEKVGEGGGDDHTTPSTEAARGHRNGVDEL